MKHRVKPRYFGTLAVPRSHQLEPPNGPGFSRAVRDAMMAQLGRQKRGGTRSPKGTAELAAAEVETADPTAGTIRPVQRAIAAGAAHRPRPKREHGNRNHNAERDGHTRSELFLRDEPRQNTEASEPHERERELGFGVWAHDLGG